MRRTCVAVLLAASVPLPGAVAAAPCARAAAVRSGTWFTATPPLPARGAGRGAMEGDRRHVRAAALDPADPRVVLVTDGTRVQRSDDGGCTWAEVWSNDPQDAAMDITDLDVARVGGRSRVLLTLVAEPPRVFANAVQARIVHSADGRTGWTTVHETVGVLTDQEKHTVGLHSGAGGVAYATVPTTTGAIGYVLSADGRTWEARSAPDGLHAVFGFAVSPWNPDEVWEWGRAVGAEVGDRIHLRRSTDGARTWQRVDPWPTYEDDPYWLLAEVAWPRRGGPARVAVLGGSSVTGTADPAAVVAWSGDGGATFGLTFPPKRLSITKGPVTHTARGDLIVAAMDGTVFRAPHTGRVPRRGDWRTLPPLPAWKSDERSFLGDDVDQTSVTSPAVVLVPAFRALRLLTVTP